MRAGEVVPLSLQLADGSNKERVFAVLYDDEFKILGQHQLAHIAGGLYVYNFYRMPSSA